MIRPPDIPIRCAALIDAPAGSVRRALRSVQVWARAATALGGEFEVADAGAELVAGGLVRFRPGRGAAVLLRVQIADELPSLVSVGTGRAWAVQVRLLVSDTAAGGLATVDFAVSSGIPLLSSAFRPVLIRYGQMLLGIATLVAREPVRVVAGALFSAGKVLLALRRSPAGRWELPGGKVEPGETDRQALQREWFEEMALRVTVLDRIGPVVDAVPGVALVCYEVERTALEAGGTAPPAESADIALVDHEEYRWVGPQELESYDLSAADRRLVDLLRMTLQSRQ